jgi:hypothetical protein
MVKRCLEGIVFHVLGVLGGVFICNLFMKVE